VMGSEVVVGGGGGGQVVEEGGGWRGWDWAREGGGR